MTWHPEESPSPTPAPAPTPTPAPAPTPTPAPAPTPTPAPAPFPAPTPTPTGTPEESLEEAESEIDFGNLNKHTIRLLSKRQLQQITPEQFRNINYDQIRFFKKDQVKHLNKKIFEGKFEDDHLYEIGKYLTRYMTRTQIRSLSPSSMNEIGLFFPLMSESTIQDFSPSQVKHIDGKHFAAFNFTLLNRFSKQQIAAFEPSQINKLNDRYFSYSRVQESVQEGGWIKHLDHSIELSDFSDKFAAKILKASLEQAVEEVIFKHLEKRRYDGLTFNWVTQGIRLDKKGEEHVWFKFRQRGDEPEFAVRDDSIEEALEVARIPASKATERMMWGIYRDLGGTSSISMTLHLSLPSSDFSKYVKWNFVD